MTLRNTLLAGGAVIALVSAALVLPSKNITQTVEVPAYTLPIASGSNTLMPTKSTSSTKKKVTNLQLDPENVVFLNTEVDSVSVDSVIQRIQDNERDGEDLYIILDCPGGSVFDGARLISYMEAATIKVNTIVVGIAASMCGHIAAHGHKRYALDRATIMYHSANGGLQGTVPEMQELLNYVARTVDKLDTYIATRSGNDLATFNLKVLRNVWIDGEDALALGLIDELATVNVRNARLRSDSSLEENILSAPKEIIQTNPLKNFR